MIIYPEKLKSQKAGLIPPGKMPGSPRIANMGIQLGIEDVGNHHSGTFVSLNKTCLGGLREVAYMGKKFSSKLQGTIFPFSFSAIRNFRILSVA